MRRGNELNELRNKQNRYDLMANPEKDPSRPLIRGFLGEFRVF